MKKSLCDIKLKIYVVEDKVGLKDGSSRQTSFIIVPMYIPSVSHCILKLTV